MFYKQIYLFTSIIILFTFSIGDEYRFPISTNFNHSVKLKHNHWSHADANSAIDIEGIEIDIFQWGIITKDTKSVIAQLINPIWGSTDFSSNNIKLPEIITISEKLNFKGMPIVYIKVIPWRLNTGKLEKLIGGEVRISAAPYQIDQTIDFYHPQLLNKKQKSLYRNINEKSNYLIIYPNEFSEAALSLEILHASEVKNEYQLNVQKVSIEEILTSTAHNTSNKNIAIREYLHELNLTTSMDYLVLLGDEIHLPPLFQNGYPSDDYYSTDISNAGVYSGFPELITGRIPANTLQEANDFIEKNRSYILNPTPGIWKSKIALVADDMYRNCTIAERDTNHTSNSQYLYNLFKNILPVFPYYAIHYNMQSCTYPDLTSDLIQNINNGFGIINYIGHGDPNTWAGEKIIQKSDLPLLHPQQDKLAIWVAGTCSFGNYFNPNSLMENILINKNISIAVVASTQEVQYLENEILINAFYNEIYNYIQNSNNYAETRLGSILYNAKNLNNNYKFHLFGDPALLLPFPIVQTGIVSSYPNEIHVAEQENISFTNNLLTNSSILIKGNEEIHTFDYGSNNFNYIVSGKIYTQMDINGSNTCFKIPMDATYCENCITIQAYEEDGEWNNKIETIDNIALINSNQESSDNQGPKILFYQNTLEIKEGNAIFPNIDITISLIDESGINLINNAIGHNTQYAFNDDPLTSIPSSKFLFTNCDTGYATIPIPQSLLSGKNKLYLESWDGVNNQSERYIDFYLLDENTYINKIYPIPSPFSDYTNFTMIVNYLPIDIRIDIYSIDGIKIHTILSNIIDADDSGFIQIFWDGRDKNGYKIANGTYFYHLKALINNAQVFENIYKIAKIE